ncbi:MAG: cyclic nucleotide-binding domain-containing protein [Pseudomonadota bacterium]
MTGLAGLASPDTIIFIAGGVQILGYLATNQIYLRSLILIGTGLYILYYFTAADDPLWSAIVMSSLQGAATILGLTLLLASRSRWAIPAAYRDIYAQFPQLPPGDFAALVKRASRLTVPDGMPLTTEGLPVENLYYVVSGSARITKGADTFQMPSGMFVGEVSLMLGQAASSTAYLMPGSEILVWSSTELMQQTARRPQLKLTLEAAIARDMATKVARAVAADRSPAPEII